MQRQLTRDKMQRILKQNMQQIIQLTKEGHFTVEEIKTAYLLRALDIAVDNNYLAELIIEDKEQSRPRQMIIGQSERQKVKPDHSLYGLTFSVADCIYQDGYDCTNGNVFRSLKPQNTNAIFIQALIDLQAMPLFRSSVNQSTQVVDNNCWVKECNNNIWGRANNPHKKEFSTGGSCGGEAALVSTFSAGIGIGIDQFGCSRYPAACCGVSAFKPTSSRVSCQGISKINMQTQVCKAVITPMARSVKDLTHIFKCLWDSQIMSHYDNSISPIKFREPSNLQSKDKALIIGYYMGDGIIEPSYSSKQALLMVKEVLEEQGHTLIEFKLGAEQQLQQIVILAYKLICSGGNLGLYTQALEGESQIEEMQKILHQAKLSNSFKDKLIEILKSLRQDRMSIIMEATKSLSAQEFIELNAQLNTQIRNFTDYWILMQFDAVISPASPLPAIPHKLSSELFTLNSNLMLYNILDYPSGVLPVKLVTSEDIKLNEQQIKGRGSSNIQVQHDRISEFMRIAQTDSQGLPIGVQVATLPNQDEKCLFIMELIEKLVGFNELSLAYLY
ncbi:fatty-acid amide hydrolase 1-like [Stylonychia lemnae]|uniref:Fatty-acid amide hydrolase 1-like n=1 Tax=Stylonychia lemnae TaxID=5949 RepID=A0A078A499_STYLE|nr:fatty-acid amide hydrolase 1-like [Stylonychia lemnae]|eukprot:CDW75584.1 fatty-acid amide hydrolase 1-like [Stylonychia lemnae]